MPPWLIGAVISKSPPYVPPREVARCLSSTHIFAAGPSELAGLIGWLTGGDGTSTRRNTRAMIRQESSNAVDHNGVAAQRSLGCSTRFNLGDRHWQCPQRSYRLRGRCREELYSSRPFEANCTGSTRAWRNTSLRVSYYWKSYAAPQIHSASCRVSHYIHCRLPLRTRCVQLPIQPRRLAIAPGRAASSHATPTAAAASWRLAAWRRWWCAPSSCHSRPLCWPGTVCKVRRPPRAHAPQRRGRGGGAAYI